MTDGTASGDFTRVAGVDQVKEGRGRCVVVDGRKVALWLKGGRYYAFADTCPHMGASLSEGFFREGNIVCHWHNWRFDAGTGACLKEGKEWASLPAYDVRVEGRDILLRPPRPEAPAEQEDEDWMSWEPPVIKKKSDT